MKVCILSDSHDNRPLLASAVRDAAARGAEEILHCGDVVAPSTLNAITGFHLPIHVIHGNNTGDLVAMSRRAARAGSLIHYYGMDGGFVLADRRIFIVHYPHYARAMAATGDWDLVCCGHDHRVAVERLPNVRGGHTWLVNPGTTAGIDAPATYVLGDLQDMSFEVHPVPQPSEEEALAARGPGAS